jgi:hypothetical protein
MKTIELGKQGFVHIRWHSVSAWLNGLSFDFGWFHNEIPLIGLQVLFFEWAEDSGGAAGLTVLRIQVLFFLFAINAHWR